MTPIEIVFGIVKLHLHFTVSICKFHKSIIAANFNNHKIHLLEICCFGLQSFRFDLQTQIARICEFLFG